MLISKALYSDIVNRPREDGNLFFSLDYFYQCWPDGPLGTYADFDFHCLSFHLHLIFKRMTVQVTYTFIPIVSHKTRFATGAKVNLGLGYLSMSCSGSL